MNNILTKKPDIELCGCWNCMNCKGNGMEPYTSRTKDDELCVMCEGQGKTKLCPAHAKSEGWKNIE
jgi:DnaJ-class molecular chaperone